MKLVNKTLQIKTHLKYRQPVVISKQLPPAFGWV